MSKNLEIYFEDPFLRQEEIEKLEDVFGKDIPAIDATVISFRAEKIFHEMEMFDGAKKLAIAMAILYSSMKNETQFEINKSMQHYCETVDSIVSKN